eukprot:TRINITY_DN969_c0_g2_i1.p1 TRINITY_DN969_c0_g2~~TRINITY_DN969_c0_g2_i1.p1  ORF type:complete len:108 (+),score=12.10 TRINITY_DN969_c0_g2_i1:153-476(+)
MEIMESIALVRQTSSSTASNGSPLDSPRVKVVVCPIPIKRRLPTMPFLGFELEEKESPCLLTGSFSSAPEILTTTSSESLVNRRGALNAHASDRNFLQQDRFVQSLL